MDDQRIDEGGTTALLRRLRPLVESGRAASGGWRDDLRLFGFTWAAGFLFFLLLIA